MDRRNGEQFAPQYTNTHCAAGAGEHWITVTVQHVSSEKLATNVKHFTT